jgi:AraC-like DNA-binding protein
MQNVTAIAVDEWAKQQMDDINKQFIQQMNINIFLPGLFLYLDDICFFLKDKDGKIISANPTLLKMYNLKNEADIIGKTDYDILERYLADKYRLDDLRVVESGAPSLNMIELVLSESGVPDWFITNKMPVYSVDHEVIGIMGTIRRISINKGDIGEENSSFIHKVLKYLATMATEGLTVKALAKNFNLSVRSIEKKFKKTLGITPKVFIIKYKISRSCEYLLKNGSISQTANDCGFYDQSSFTVQFKKVMGITPFQYLKNLNKIF